MNGLDALHVQEFSSRMAALSEEEQAIAVKYIDDQIMFEELAARSKKRQAIISTIEKVMERRVDKDVC